MTAGELPMPGPAPSGLPVPAPCRTPDVALGPAAERARRAVAGFASSRLLAEVSVARAAGLVAENVREPAAWIRELLAGLEAFRQAQPGRRLAPVLAAAWASPARGEQALSYLVADLDGASPAELARLGFGPKLWLTANGVAVRWAPLSGAGSAPPAPAALPRTERERFTAAAGALRRVGVGPEELALIRLGDLGRLVPAEVFVPDLLADPLVVRLRPARCGRGAREAQGTGGPPWLALLGYEARITVIAAVLTRYGPDAACRHGGDRLLREDDLLPGDHLVRAPGPG